MLSAPSVRKADIEQMCAQGELRDYTRPIKDIVRAHMDATFKRCKEAMGILVLVGNRRVAVFIREAVEKDLQRREGPPPTQE